MGRAIKIISIILIIFSIFLIIILGNKNIEINNDIREIHTIEGLDNGDVRVFLRSDMKSEKFDSLDKVEEKFSEKNGFLFCTKGVDPFNTNIEKNFCQFTKVTIDKEEDIYSLRQVLIDEIWPDGFPKRFPNKIIKDINDPFHDVKKINNLAGIDRLVIDTYLGFNSVAYHFHPVESNNKVFIYHYGHHDDSDIMEDPVLKRLLEEGYSVITLFMPLFSENNKPIININGVPTKLENHDQFIDLESEEFNPLILFLEPIAVTVNYLDSSLEYESISMMGISGGGWSTAVYSIFDERIKKSYPIAGIMPLSIFDPGRDYEQKLRGLLDKASSLDLFIIGSYGEGRKQTQIFIMDDTCCFKGKWYLENPYASVIQENLDRLGQGEFEVMIDDSIDGHYISESVIEKILSYENSYEL